MLVKYLEDIERKYLYFNDLRINPKIFRKAENFQKFFIFGF